MLTSGFQSILVISAGNVFKEVIDEVESGRAMPEGGEWRSFAHLKQQDCHHDIFSPSLDPLPKASKKPRWPPKIHPPMSMNSQHRKAHRQQSTNNGVQSSRADQNREQCPGGSALWVTLFSRAVRKLPELSLLWKGGNYLLWYLTVEAEFKINNGWERVEPISGG